MSNPITPLTPDQTVAQEQQAADEGYIHRVLVGFDQFVNVIFGGLPCETISSRAARASVQGAWWGVQLSAFLNWFQSDHGAKAQAGDVERAQRVRDVEVDSGDV